MSYLVPELNKIMIFDVTRNIHFYCMLPLFASCTLKKSLLHLDRLVNVCKKLLVLKLQHLNNGTSVYMNEETQGTCHLKNDLSSSRNAILP